MKPTSKNLTAGNQQSSPDAKRKETPGGSQRRKNRGNHVYHGGIHHRRDKRFPFAAGRVKPEDLDEERSYDASPDEVVEPLAVPDWQQALMLWLSWNSTYEKVTARMCKPGQDKDKLEAMMDEMDQLRRRAIDISEQLMDDTSS